LTPHDAHIKHRRRVFLVTELRWYWQLSTAKWK